MKKSTHVRLSAITVRQLEELISSTGGTQTDVIAIAIDRMYQQENKTMTSIRIPNRNAADGIYPDLLPDGATIYEYKNQLWTGIQGMQGSSHYVELTPITDTQRQYLAQRGVLKSYTQEKQTMNATQARKLAEEAIQAVEGDDGTPVADTTIVGINDDGYYWVTDNGEEVDHLTREQAIAIIIENLTASNEDE